MYRNVKSILAGEDAEQWFLQISHVIVLVVAVFEVILQPPFIFSSLNFWHLALPLNFSLVLGSSVPIGERLGLSMPLSCLRTRDSSYEVSPVKTILKKGVCSLLMRNNKHPHIRTLIFQVRLNRFLQKIDIYSSFRLSRFKKIYSRHL